MWNVLNRKSLNWTLFHAALHFLDFGRFNRAWLYKGLKIWDWQEMTDWLSGYGICLLIPWWLVSWIQFRLEATLFLAETFFKIPRCQRNVRFVLKTKTSTLKMWWPVSSQQSGSWIAFKILWHLFSKMRLENGRFMGNSRSCEQVEKKDLVVKGNIYMIMVWWNRIIASLYSEFQLEINVPSYSTLQKLFSSYKDYLDYLRPFDRSLHREEQKKSSKIATGGDWTQGLLIITLMLYRLC